MKDPKWLQDKTAGMLNINDGNVEPDKICIHASCSLCNGTGKKLSNGSACLHYASCSCPNCNPQYSNKTINS